MSATCDEACPSTTNPPWTTTATAPAVTTTIHDDDAAPAAPPPPKRRKAAAAAAAPAVVDEKARLKRRIEWVMDKIAAQKDDAVNCFGYVDACYGYAGYGFVGWVREDFAGEEHVGERAALEAWMQIEWERRLHRWRRDEKLGINDDATFGVWDDDQQEEGNDKIQPISLKSN